MKRILFILALVCISCEETTVIINTCSDVNQSEFTSESECTDCAFSAALKTYYLGGALGEWKHTLSYNVDCGDTIKLVSINPYASVDVPTFWRYSDVDTIEFNTLIEGQITGYNVILLTSCGRSDFDFEIEPDGQCYKYEN